MTQLLIFLICAIILVVAGVFSMKAMFELFKKDLPKEETKKDDND